MSILHFTHPTLTIPQSELQKKVNKPSWSNARETHKKQISNVVNFSKFLLTKLVNP